jgi:hypothetical protein
MGEFTDVSFFVAGLALYAGLGWPICAAIPAEVKGRFWAAPVLGLSVFGVFTTLAYRSGLPLPYAPLASALCASAACALPRLRVRAFGRIDARTGGIAACAIIVLGLLTLSPKWAGGFQFAAFQGNHYDQANYISNASAYAQLSYAELAHISEANTLANTYNHFAASQLSARPAVAFILAALRTPFYDTTFEAAYAYLALLQALTFFAAVFVLRAVFAVSLLSALFLGLALATGTYLQLIFDINAWSQLAATPQVLVLVAVVALLFAGTRRGGSFVSLAASATGVCYVYPEITLIAGFAAAGVALGWRLTQASADWIRSIKPLALAGTASLLACVPYWHGTMGFVLFQAQLIGQKAYPTEWFFYYYRFLFGRNEHAIDIILNAAIPAQNALFSALSLPIDFALGALGVYFLSPEPGDGRTLGILLDCAVVIGLIVSVISATRNMRSANPAGFALLCGALLALAVPALMFASGRMWAGGKGLLMAAPLLYFVLIAPLLIPMPRRLKLLPLLLVCAQLAFALQRPIAAQSPDGIHRRFPPYPTIMEKATFDWDLPRHKSRLSACSAVALDLAHPVLDRIARTFASDLGLRWYSQRPLRSYFDQGVDLGRQRPIGEADCVLTDGANTADEERGRQRISLRPSR